jgi:hypothetical protein
VGRGSRAHAGGRGSRAGRCSSCVSRARQEAALEESHTW